MSASRLPAFLLAGLAACGGVAPDPEAIAADLPSPREPTAAERDELARLRRELQVQQALQLVDEVEEKAHEILALDPRDARATAALGTCWMRRAQRRLPPDLSLWRRAEGQLRKAQRLAPEDPEVALQLAAFFEADGHLAAAAAALDPVAFGRQRHVGVLRALSRLRYELGEEKLAIAALQALLVEDPGDVQATFRLAHAQARVATAAAACSSAAFAIRRFSTACSARRGRA